MFYFLRSVQPMLSPATRNFLASAVKLSFYKASETPASLLIALNFLSIQLVSSLKCSCSAAGAKLHNIFLLDLMKTRF